MLSLQMHFKERVNLWRERLSCSSPGCRNTRRIWGRLSDGRGSVQLHGQRFCFPTCFEQELRAHFSGLLSLQRQQHRPTRRVPLGLLMLSRGELSDQQLRHALEAQRHGSTGRIGEWMQKLGYVDERQVTAALGAQWSCPVLRSLPASPTVSAIPFALLRAFEMVPVHYAPASRVLHIAFARDIEYQALLAIEHVLDCKAEPCVASRTAVRLILRSREEQHRPSEFEFEGVSGAEEMCRIASSYAASVGAQQVQLARCGGQVWAKIWAKKESLDLVFGTASTSSALGVGRCNQMLDACGLTSHRN